MNDFQLYTKDTASPDAARLLSGLAAQIGFVPNVFAVLGGSPKTLEAFASMNAQFGACSLTAIEREIVQTAISVANTCAYCVAGHTAFAEMQGLDTDALEAVRQGQGIDNPRHESLRKFAEALNQTRGRDAGNELSEFLAAGYRKDQAFDVILGIAIKTISNLTSGITDISLDQSFIPFTWSPSDDQSKAA